MLDLLSPLAAAPMIAGGQAIGPGAVFSAGGTSLYAIDPAIFDLVQGLFADGAIDRDDMIQILQSAVVNGSLTPAALDALEVLTDPQNEARLNMPDYVAVLASDVVDGSPANAFYQGQPLGNLADQASDQARGTALEDLVGKWFYGTDTPAAQYGTTYCVTAGSLFGNDPDAALDVPSAADVQQGDVGDCYFIAALGALAGSCPSAIENMFIDNGIENGMQTWTVRFYYDTPQGYTADYVTVNAKLPGVVATCPLYAKPSLNGGWWMPLLEKAYAEWNETGHEGATDRTPTRAFRMVGWARWTSKSSAARRPTIRRPALPAPSRRSSTRSKRARQSRRESSPTAAPSSTPCNWFPAMPIRSQATTPIRRRRTTAPSSLRTRGGGTSLSL